MSLRRLAAALAVTLPMAFSPAPAHAGDGVVWSRLDAAIHINCGPACYTGYPGFVGSSPGSVTGVATMVTSSGQYLTSPVWGSIYLNFYCTGGLPLDIFVTLFYSVVINGFTYDRVIDATSPPSGQALLVGNDYLLYYSGSDRTAVGSLLTAADSNSPTVNFGNPAASDLPVLSREFCGGNTDYQLDASVTFVSAGTGT